MNTITIHIKFILPSLSEVLREEPAEVIDLASYRAKKGQQSGMFRVLHSMPVDPPEDIFNDADGPYTRALKQSLYTFAREGTFSLPDQPQQEDRGSSGATIINFPVARVNESPKNGG